MLILEHRSKEKKQEQIRLRIKSSQNKLLQKIHESHNIHSNLVSLVHIFNRHKFKEHHIKCVQKSCTLKYFVLNVLICFYTKISFLVFVTSFILYFVF
ncbi:hypothetical protein ACP275_11G089900 [Erythranthe tilingii]